MAIEGKGFFIWQIPNCEKGDVNAIVSLAQAAKLNYVAIKVADTLYSYNIYNGVDRVPALVQALRAHNIQPFGWHYVKGDDPIGEANKAIQRVRDLQLGAYIIDAEAEYKDPGKATAATKFMNQLRASLPNTPIALSSYRYPSYHPQIPWKQFLEKCDYNMPQVYWMFAHNPGDQLTRSVREFQAMTPYRPVIPIGAAFKEDGWNPTSAEVLEFLQTAQSLNLSSATFYSWDSARSYVTDVWNTIRDYDWSGTPIPQDITTQYVNALNTHNPDQVVGLYNPSAVHVTAARTIQGTTAIRAWYQLVFTQLLPNASFILTGFSGTGSSRHFTWTATSPQGKVENGNDTLGLIDGRIAYHYSFFTVS
jgi:hypothetical protein